MITSKYFSEKEFNRCTPSCSLQDMNQEFMNKLDQLRELSGIPLVINSAFRSVQYEKSKGRNGTSAHVLGVAIDIRCNDSQNRFKVLEGALKLGFKRIGVANSFIHVDISKKHAQNVIWTY